MAGKDGTSNGNWEYHISQIHEFKLKKNHLKQMDKVREGEGRVKEK